MLKHVREEVRSDRPIEEREARFVNEYFSGLLSNGLSLREEYCPPCCGYEGEAKDISLFGNGHDSEHHLLALATRICGDLNSAGRVDWTVGKAEKSLAAGVGLRKANEATQIKEKINFILKHQIYPKASAKFTEPESPMQSFFFRVSIQPEREDQLFFVRFSQQLSDNVKVFVSVNPPGREKQLRVIERESIYEAMMNIRKSLIARISKACRNPLCQRSYERTKRILVNFQLKPYQNGSIEPAIEYEYSYVILLGPDKKHEGLKKLREELKGKKKITIPFEDYRNNSKKTIVCLNCPISERDLHTILQSNKFGTLFKKMFALTKCLRVDLRIPSAWQGLEKMEAKVASRYQEATRLVRDVDGFDAYYYFESLGQALFAFTFLDNEGIHSFFHNDKNGKKTEKQVNYASTNKKCHL